MRMKCVFLSDFQIKSLKSGSKYIKIASVTLASKSIRLQQLMIMVSL